MAKQAYGWQSEACPRGREFGKIRAAFSHQKSRVSELLTLHIIPHLDCHKISMKKLQLSDNKIDCFTPETRHKTVNKLPNKNSNKSLKTPINITQYH
jgi:hypothetical protein